MQRQKTVAKWLVIILLLTVAVGAYIMYDALYVTGGNTAQGDIAGEEIPSPDDTAPPSPDPPVYTTLPRPSGTYAGITVAHAGGEGNERVLDCVMTGERTHLFLLSDSEGYDCRGEGMYVAVFSAEELLSVTRFAGADAVFGGAKLTADGVAAAVSEGEEGKLFLFDSAGGVKAQAALPAFSSAFMLLASGRLNIFAECADGLNFIEVREGFRPILSPFRLPSSARVREGFAIGDSFTLAASGEDETLILTFSQNSGFKCAKSYPQTEFRQIVPVAGEDGAAFVMLAATRDGVMLAVLSAEGGEIAATVREGSRDAAVFGDGVSVTLVRSGITETFCRHLDLISSSPTSLILGEVTAARGDGNARVIVATEGGVTTVYSASSEGEFIPLLQCGPAEGDAVIEIAGDTLIAALSTTSSDGIFFENFGGSDAYLVKMPL